MRKIGTSEVIEYNTPVIFDDIDDLSIETDAIFYVNDDPEYENGANLKIFFDGKVEFNFEAICDNSLAIAEIR